MKNAIPPPLFFVSLACYKVPRVRPATECLSRNQFNVYINTHTRARVPAPVMRRCLIGYRHWYLYFRRMVEETRTLQEIRLSLENLEICLPGEGRGPGEEDKRVGGGGQGGTETQYKQGHQTLDELGLAICINYWQIAHSFLKIDALKFLE